jgi:uncharacterized membrane protein
MLYLRYTFANFCFVVQHPGPAQVYLSKAPGSVKSYDGSGDWFKVQQDLLCKSGNAQALKSDAWCIWKKNNIEFTVPNNIVSLILLHTDHTPLNAGSSFSHSPTANTSSAANTSPSTAPTTSKPNSTTHAHKSKSKAAKETPSPRASRSPVSTKSTTRPSTSASGALLPLTLLCLALLLLLAVALLDLLMERLLVLLLLGVLCRVVRLLLGLLLKLVLRWRLSVIVQLLSWFMAWLDKHRMC